MVVLTTPTASSTIVSLVRTRGREEVVLFKDHSAVLRHLTSFDYAAMGVFWLLAHGLIEASRFAPHSPTTVSDSNGGVMKIAQ